MSGLPPVSRVISTKLLKLKAKAAISSGVSGLMISGRVIRNMLVRGPPPSTAEASYRSRGTDCKSPMHNSSM